MLDEFPVQFKSTDMVMTPTSNTIFEEDNSKLLWKKDSETYDTFVAKCVFLCKRARLDIQPAVAVLATRVQKSNTQDWQSLVRLMKYLNGTKKYHLTLGIGNLRMIKWYVDTFFVVYPDFYSHIGGIMTMGTGAIQAGSMKQ